MRKIVFLIIYGFSLFSNVLHGSNIPSVGLEFRYLNVNNGLPSNKINEICEDKNGYIWFATEGGLCRYDGYEIKIYKEIKDDTLSLRGSSIPSVFCDRNGNLWIGVEGLNLYNYETDNFSRIEPVNFDDFGDIYSFYEDDNGILWLGTNNKGVCKYYPSENRFEEFAPFNFSLNLLSKSNVNVIKQSKEGCILLGTESCGFIIYDPATNYVLNSKYNMDENFPSGNIRIREIFVDQNGDYWLGSYDNGLFRFIKKDQKFKHYTIDKKELGSNRIRAIHKDKFGHFWFGTRSGLYLYLKDYDRFIRYAHENHIRSILSQNSIFDIFEDTKGGLWLGTYSGGVNYTDLFQKEFISYRSKSNNNKYLNNQNVFCVVRDADYNLWIGTENGGLNYYNRHSGKFTYYKNNPNNKNSILSNNVKEILIDENENLWIGTYNGGLSYFNTKSKSFKNYSINEKSEIILPNDDVYSLLIDSKDHFLWVGTRKGLIKYDRKRKKTIPVEYDGEFVDNTINNLYEDNNGNVWILAQADIFRYNLESKKLYKEDRINTDGDRNYTIYVDRYENVWVGGNAGLVRYDPKSGESIKFNNIINKDLENVYGILQNKSDLWISSNNGLYKLTNIIECPDSFNVKKFGVDDGLLNTLFIYNSFFKAEDGEMFFGGVNGLNSFYPQKIRDNPIKPDLVLNNLTVYNQTLKVGQKIKDHTVLNKTLNESGKVTLLYNENFFTIEFSGLHYSQPEQIRYRYRLKGFDEEWTYTDAKRRHASYSNLPFGHYTFEVMAANPDNLWNTKPVTVEFIIKPAFWQTILFRVFVVVFIGVSIFLIYSYRVKTIRTMNLQLEQTVKKRTEQVNKKNVMLELQAMQLSEKNKTLEENKKQIEKQAKDLVNSNILLKELNTTKDKFFSIIAHDIKNPFIGMLGAIDVLTSSLEDMSKDDIRSILHVLDSSSRNLYSLLENLLFWARSQTNKLKFTPGFTDVKTIIEKNIELFRDNISNKDLRIIVEGDFSKEAFVDKNMVNTVIQNLLSNAIKFTPESGLITITSDIENDHMRIAIKDTGVGMLKEEIEGAFKIDYAVSKPGTNGESGTGLGLILCREFVSKNKGEIWCESAYGKGSAFYFTLPLFEKKEEVISEIKNPAKTDDRI